jgi:nitroreductase
MRNKMLAFVVLIALPAMVFGQSKGPAIANFISSAYSVKAFTTFPVDSKDLAMILQCGVRAPSARNAQPWHFTVVKDLETMKKIIPDALEGNMLIVISGQNQGDHAAVAFDCALATENMYLAAQSLGLGSHIYTGPIAKFNEQYKALVRLPAGYLDVAILKVGNIGHKTDAVSSASQRRADSEMIDYR